MDYGDIAETDLELGRSRFGQPTRTYSQTLPWIELWDSGLRFSDVFPGPKSYGRASDGIVWDGQKRFARENKMTHAPCVFAIASWVRVQPASCLVHIPLRCRHAIESLQEMFGTCTS